MENKSKKRQAKKNNKQKDVIDLTSYLSPEAVNADVNGSYTGVTKATYYEDVFEEPDQDVDDL